MGILNEITKSQKILKNLPEIHDTSQNRIKYFREIKYWVEKS